MTQLPAVLKTKIEPDFRMVPAVILFVLILTFLVATVYVLFSSLS
jgi:hypothetical protein